MKVVEVGKLWGRRQLSIGHEDTMKGDVMESYRSHN
jgi:hypothetical protein